MLVLRKSIYYILFAFLLGFVSIVHAQYTDVRFIRLTINDGLSLSSVYCIYQDSKGYMWFGTEDGLNKYDGRNFIIYRAIPGDEKSIAHKWIELIYEDTHGILWFGSCGGLSRFDPVHEIFTHYKSNQEDAYQFLNDTITCIQQVSEDYILVGTYGGLNQINLQSMESKSVALEGMSGHADICCIESLDDGMYVVASNEGLFQVNINTGTTCKIVLDGDITITTLLIHEELVWIGTENGVYTYNYTTCDKTTEELVAENVLAFSGLHVEQIAMDEALNRWISTPEGLYKTDTCENTMLIIPTERSTHSLALIPGKNVHQDANKNIWYATHGDGVYRINHKTGEINNFRNNPCDPESLSENAINCIYQDMSGSIWFGTFGAGINVFNQSSQKFKLLRHDPSTTNTLVSNFVWTICEDRKGNIWIGSNDKGISIYTPETKNFVHYDHEPGNPRSLSHSSVRKIYEDSEGTIWLGTDGGGLNKFDKKTGSFIHYVSDRDNPKSISDNSVRAIYEDLTGTLWVGTRNGLNRFDRQENSFIRYMHSPDDVNSLSHNFVYSALYRDSRDNLWIGTYGGGLDKLDIASGKFEHFRYNPEDKNSLSDDVVFSFVEDSSGIMWIGTNSQLNRFDPETGLFSRFGIDQGLPNEVIYGVVPDDLGNFWLSTNYGICRFNPRDSSTVNYDFTHGLQSNEFNGGAYHRGHSGNIYFGGVYGLNIIDPDMIGAYRNQSKMVISRIEILGRDVKVQSGGNSLVKRNKIIKDSLNYCIQENISYASEIILDYYIRYFSLEFIDLGNMHSTNTNYTYIMEGLDESWHNSGNRNFVSYANMQPGKYRFKVKSQQPDGPGNNSVAEIDIIITPPFWKSWWFILFETVLALAIAYSIYMFLVKLKTYRILEENNERINNANKQLKRSEQNLKLINATKDKFFSIISHDLKNPFTSLLSISETMKENYEFFEEEEKRSSTERIHGSIRNIYNLLENLLTWSRTQTGRIQFNPEKFNLSELLKENFILYSPTASKKNIELVANYEEGIMVLGDRNMINAVIRNLLNNGLKFTFPGKRVEIGIHDHSESVEVYIKDEGVGISEEDRQKLFRIDQKLKTTGTDGEKGTGLGLIICKEFIEKNNGRIIVNSVPGKGSTFSFTVPK